MSLSTPGRDKCSTGGDAVVLFIERLARNISEKFIDRQEVHVPFFRKREVQDVFIE